VYIESISLFIGFLFTPDLIHYYASVNIKRYVQFNLDKDNNNNFQAGKLFMSFSRKIHLLLPLVGIVLPTMKLSLSTVIAVYNLLAVVVISDDAIEDLDKAILDDIIQSYSTHEPSTCKEEQSSSTSFSFTWPGTNTQSSWNTDFVGYEQGLFQAIMSHNDPTGKNLSWSIRIGSGGNMYSIIYPDLFGELIPPQKHVNAPWIDEVHQMVAVPLDLNSAENPSYMHQAGACK